MVVVVRSHCGHAGFWGRARGLGGLLMIHVSGLRAWRLV
jgi:hypothetical protein